MRFNRIGVERLGATIGAEISGVDLRLPFDDETFAEVERALFFRDQDLSPAEHAAFGRRFGEHCRRLACQPAVTASRPAARW